MQSNISSSRRQRILSALSSLKNRSVDTYKLLLVYILLGLLICQIAVSRTMKLSGQYKTWLGWMSAFTSTLILDQTILRSFSIPLDFWYPHVVAVIFFSTTSLWLLVVSEAKTKELLSIIFRRDSK